MIRPVLVAFALLSSGLCPRAEGQTPPSPVSFEWRSQLDGDQLALHPQILDEARREVLRMVAPAWLRNCKSADECRAREQAFEHARQSPANFVTLQIHHGPTGRRLGANGYVAGSAVVHWPALESIFATKLQSSRRQPRYKVMVLVSEYVTGQRSEIAKSSAAIEDALAAAGATVINERRFAQLRERKLDYARLAQRDHDIIARIVHEEGVQILITGTVRTGGAQRAPIGGGQFAKLYTADCTVSGVWAATAKTIFGFSGPFGRRTYASPALAIEGVASELAQACAREIANVAPNDEIELSIDGVDTPEFEHDIRAWIEAIVGPGAIRGDALSGTRLTLTLQTDLAAYELAKQLVERAEHAAGRFTLRQTERALGTVEFIVELR